MIKKQGYWFYFHAGMQDGTPVYARVTKEGTEYPYISRREVYQDCNRNGRKAKIMPTEAEARLALHAYGVDK